MQTTHRSMLFLNAYCVKTQATPASAALVMVFCCVKQGEVYRAAAAVSTHMSAWVIYLILLCLETFALKLRIQPLVHECIQRHEHTHVYNPSCPLHTHAL
ncbi:hypothetical protein ILYODFUR_034862 [Ilyodon furcidens]|uniref:Secreted protein n=1 Tax=Ilyodon furcidens TaxID=33524 RepID=A0ABV0U356_9TELE